MTPEQVARLRELLGKATPGPWEWRSTKTAVACNDCWPGGDHHAPEIRPVGHPSWMWMTGTRGHGEAERSTADAALIAALRNDAAALLDAVEAGERVVAAVEAKANESEGAAAAMRENRDALPETHEDWVDYNNLALRLDAEARRLHAILAATHPDAGADEGRA